MMDAITGGSSLLPASSRRPLELGLLDIDASLRGLSAHGVASGPEVSSLLLCAALHYFILGQPEAALAHVELAIEAGKGSIPGVLATLAPVGSFESDCQPGK